MKKVNELIEKNVMEKDLLFCKKSELYREDSYLRWEQLKKVVENNFFDVIKLVYVLSYGKINLIDDLNNKILNNKPNKEENNVLVYFEHNGSFIHFRNDNVFEDLDIVAELLGCGGIEEYEIQNFHDSMKLKYDRFYRISPEDRLRLIKYMETNISLNMLQWESNKSFDSIYDDKDMSDTIKYIKKLNLGTFGDMLINQIIAISKI